MNDFGDTEYKKVVVVAIHMINVEELLFEVNGAIEWKKYQDFITESMEILQGVRGLLDIVMYNGSVCGIYSVLGDVDVVKKIGEDVRNLSWKKRKQIEDGTLVSLIYGVGIAEGITFKISVEKYGQMQKEDMWLGNVLKRADAMAQMSLCDGRGKIFIEK